MNKCSKLQRITHSHYKKRKKKREVKTDPNKDPNNIISLKMNERCDNRNGKSLYDER